MTKRSKTKIIPVLKALLIASAALIFSACSTSQQAPSRTAYENTQSRSIEVNTQTKKTPIFSEPIEQIELDERESPLKDIESLINAKQYDHALGKINSTDQKRLTLNEQARLNLAKASVLSAKNQNQQSIETLNQIQLNLLSREQTARYFWIKARATYLNNDYQSSLEALAERNAFINSVEQANNQAMMTKITSSLSAEQVTLIKQQTTNRDLQYWLSQQSFSNLTPQIDNSQSYISETQNQIGSHSLNKISSSWSQHSPQQIAVLLPFSSKYSQAAEQFKEGINKAHIENNDSKPYIKFYDVGDSGSINSVIRSANQQGADLIIGPLGNQAAEIALSSNSRAPVLALGGISQSSKNFTFALNPEIEIQAIVEHAKSKGLKSALVFSPNSGRGNRLASAFQTLWNVSGGQSEVHTFKSGEYDHSAAIKSAMGIYGSEYRHTKLNNTIGMKTKFTAVKKPNIDMIFLASDISDASNLKPQINYFDGHNVPTYGLSSLNTNSPETEKTDLDGIIIPEMPAIINQSSSSKLEALGYDAYQLIPILTNLRLNSGNAYQGETGLLTIDKQGNTKRKPSWVKFSSGKLNPL